MEILELFSETQDALPLAAVAERTGLTREKALRMLMTLRGKGLLEKEESSAAFRLGFGALELSQRIIGNFTLVNHAHPVMEELARKHDEAVYMTVLKGDETLFVDMVDCTRQIRAASLLGRRMPFFTNAAGKALKAMESGDVMEKLLRKRRGIPHPEVLVSELTAIRQSGVAVDNGGVGEGIMTVAVAIRDYAGRAVGALTVLGPSFRLVADRLEEEIIPSLLESAGLLSQKFGYAPA